MCGEIFWKRVVVFSLTFGLGVSVSGFFIAKELPAQNIKPAVVPAPAENKNCVPVDENLKYQTLENAEPVVSVQSEETPKLGDSKKYEKPKLRKENRKKREPSSGPQFYDPAKDSAEYKQLLHMEKCFETQGAN